MISREAHLMRAAAATETSHGRRGVLLNQRSRWRVSNPLARFARVSPSRGGDQATLPLFEGETRAKRARGSLTRHVELDRGYALSPLRGFLKH